MGLFNRKSKIQENSVATSTPDIKNENRELVFSDTSFVSISALYPNELDVLNNSAVWSAVRYISSIISTLPLHTFKKNGKVREIGHFKSKGMTDKEAFDKAYEFIKSFCDDHKFKIYYTRLWSVVEKPPLKKGNPSRNRKKKSKGDVSD